LQNCVPDFAKHKQSDAEFEGNSLLRMVIIDRVINILLGGLTLDSAGMHCPSWDDAFVSSCFFLCLSRSQCGAPCVRGVHSSYKHCVAVYCPISTRFAAFFHNGLLFQNHYLFRIFVARWSHNFRAIVVKNCLKSKNLWKSLCARLRIDS